MDEQQSLFTVLDGGKSDNIDGMLKCFRSELKSVDFMSLEELFSGFNTIKAITFSYDIGFIDKIMRQFEFGEIILGGNFLVQKDTKIQELLAEICTNAYEAGKAVNNYDKLAEMLSSGDVEFRTPTFVLDHRKIYMLKSDSGKIRVIKASANMSRRAWNNDQIEHYEYDDTLECYEAYANDFEAAWELSRTITMDVVSSNKADNLVEANAILKGAKETGKTIVLQQTEETVVFDNIKYTIDHDTIKEEYKAILTDINPKAKNGMIEIKPKMLEKIEHNQKKIAQKKVTVNNIQETYPELILDLYNKEAYLNEDKLDLSPTADEVKNDIDEINGIFANFNQFVASDVEKLKRIHFKLMNAIFCSPFNAKFRCTAKIVGKPTSSLPMFALISSETSNSGKTFMVKATLKLMTGKDLDGVKSCDYIKDNIRTTQIGIKGIPFFVDEIDNAYISRIKDIIKNPEKCEDNQIDTMPMLLFASNDVLKPDEPIRKRMVFFTIDGALPSTIDKTAYESKGKAIIKKLGNGFYREYLKRMLDKAKDEIDFMIHSHEIPDEYYPDLMAMSSDVIVSIFEDYGYALPAYMHKLTWKDDYSSDSNADDAIFEIGAFCKSNKKACTITKNLVTIELGTDKNSQKKIDSWKNILPAEMKATAQTTRDCSKISINRKELEARLGYKLGGFSIFDFFRRK